MEFPTDPVLNYAVARLGSVIVEQKNWELAESLLLQAVSNEPGTLQRVVQTLVNYQSHGYPINRGALEEVLNQLILRHAPLGHSSEVAWALWCAIEFGLSVQDEAADKAIAMEDAVVTLVSLHAVNLGLINSSVSLSGPSAKMTVADLYEEHWLLSYEANVKGWLPSFKVQDHVAQSQEFNFLKRNQVEFYRVPSRLQSAQPGQGPVTAHVYAA